MSKRTKKRTVVAELLMNRGCELFGDPGKQRAPQRTISGQADASVELGLNAADAKPEPLAT
jgi:hypothetical protein